MKISNRHKANTAAAACRPCTARANESARAAGHATREQRRDGLNVPRAAFASLAGAAGLPFVTF